MKKKEIEREKEVQGKQKDGKHQKNIAMKPNIIYLLSWVFSISIPDIPFLLFCINY
jgi:hypothetical protein